MTFARQLRAIAILPFIAGCGNVAVTEQTPSTTATCAASDGCGTSTETSTGTDTATGTTTDTDTGTVTNTNTLPAECAAFADEAGLETVTVRVHNETGHTVYLDNGGCEKLGSPYAVMVTPWSTDDKVDYSNNNYCFQSCETLQLSEKYLGCDCLPSLTVVQPGHSADLAWNGTGRRFFDDDGTLVSMPTECWKKNPGWDNCGRTVAAPPGMYTARVKAHPGCVACDACTGTGNCSPAAPSGPVAVHTPVSFSFPGTAVVDIVLDACAFGCP